MSKKYLKFIKEQPCLICFLKADAHHLVSRGAGGNDYQVIPLCRHHHSELHQTGMDRFQAKYQLNLWKHCASYLVKYFLRGK